MGFMWIGVVKAAASQLLLDVEKQNASVDWSQKAYLLMFQRENANAVKKYFSSSFLCVVTFSPDTD